jgi:hypothetical protein
MTNLVPHLVPPADYIDPTELAAAEALKADANHNHDTAYAAIEHNHDLEYLALGAAPVLTDTVWEDLRFPAQGINPPGNAEAAQRSTTTGYLEFLGDADNAISGVAQMPHAWKVGSTIYPHIHVRFANANAGNTRWRLDYDVADINGNFANAAGTFTAGTAVTLASPASSTKHNILGLGSINMAGKGLSCIVLWKLTRLSTGDALDTYTGTVGLLEFDIHYEIDAMGSSEELVK